jgi:glycosyltransferase involved in cell wall biosynthesis
VIREGSLAHRYFQRKELAQYEAADVIGVESPGNLRYFADEFAHKNYRLEVLLNWASVQNLPLATSNYRSQLGLTGKVVFFYGGNIGVAQDMDNIVRLAAGLEEHGNIFFLLVGSGSEAPRLKAEIQKRGLTNMAILPPVPQDEYLRMLGEFDVGLISLDKRLPSNNLTGKLLGYMTCRLPVLASVNPGNDLTTFLHKFQAGISCENGNDECLRAAAIRLAKDHTLREAMGRNSRSLLEKKFSVQAAAAQILSHFQNMDVSSAREMPIFVAHPTAIEGVDAGRFCAGVDG